MDARSAARLLRISTTTLSRWVRQGLLRSADGAGEEFDRAEVERWARSRGIAIETGGRAHAPLPDDLLAAAVARGSVVAEAVAENASEAIALAVRSLEGLGEGARDRLIEDTLTRERMASTALGHGVALPHPRTPPGDLVSEPTVSVLFPAEPLDWAALDGERVHTVLLLLSPSAPAHLQVLSRIAFALRQPGFAAFLRERPDRDALAERLRAIRRDGA